jgi:ribosomal protein S18 acetylase RimI-like enzyme
VTPVEPLEPWDLRHLRASDASVVLDAGHLFDHPPTHELVERYLRRDGHHLIMAFVDDQPAGFVSGVEVDHPDKPTEMMLYELGVDEPFRRRGIGRALVTELLALAARQRCTGMWVPVEADDQQALAFYRSVGQAEHESAEIFWWDAAASGVAKTWLS